MRLQGANFSHFNLTKTIRIATLPKMLILPKEQSGETAQAHLSESEVQPGCCRQPGCFGQITGNVTTHGQR